MKKIMLMWESAQRMMTGRLFERMYSSSACMCFAGSDYWTGACALRICASMTYSHSRCVGEAPKPLSSHTGPFSYQYTNVQSSSNRWILRAINTDDGKLANPQT